MSLANYRRRLNRKISRAIGPGARRLTKSLLDADIPGPVFIVGPPRSGTTLLSQILASRFEFASFRMLSAELVYCPVVGAMLERWLMRLAGAGRSFRSDYGRTSGVLGLHEAGEFWYRWFPRGEAVYVAPGKTPKSDLDELNREVTSLAAVNRAPLLHKNTYNSMRIAPLVEAFPRACFLVATRDPDANARSILKGRYGLLNNPEKWWSVPPKEFPRIRTEHYCDQVVDQVFFIERQILEDRKRYGAEKFLIVSYEELCSDVPRILELAGGFLESHGIPLHVRGEVPDRFDCSTGPRFPEEEEVRIADRVRSRWAATV